MRHSVLIQWKLALGLLPSPLSDTSICTLEKRVRLPAKGLAPKLGLQVLQLGPKLRAYLVCTHGRGGRCRLLD